MINSTQIPRAAAIALLALAPAAPAFAGMSAEEFEGFVTGQTFTYADRGIVYGMEEYLPNRRVRWSYVGDQCQEGYWYEAAGEICFVYDERPKVPQCWVFTQAEGGLRATFMGATSGQELYEARRSSEPLACLGPNVGV